LAKTNFGYEKRQRELAKQKKKEEKLKRKLEKNAPAPGQNPDQPPVEDAKGDEKIGTAPSV
jgi:hypothetical protein